MPSFSRIVVKWKTRLIFSEATEIQLATDSEQIRSCYGIHAPTPASARLRISLAIKYIVKSKRDTAWRISIIMEGLGALAGFRFFGNWLGKSSASMTWFLMQRREEMVMVKNLKMGDRRSKKGANVIKST